MKRLKHSTYVVVPVMALLALFPLARLAADWYELSRVGLPVQPAGNGYDWVLWQEQDGIISAAYVHPDGPAAAAGMEKGDIFFMLEYQQLFFIEALKGAIAGIEPGTTRTYSVQRGDGIVEMDVTFTRYPTFLYPFSSALWQFSLWGFTLGAFLHIVGLIIVGPLALRSRQARFSLVLILASSLWIFSNLLRLFMVELFGPPYVPGSAYDMLFQGLTLVGLIGWIGFPGLLLHRALSDVLRQSGQAATWLRWVVYVPASVLGTAALLTTLRGPMGPVTPETLVVPILFYACCYVATASALMLLLRASYRQTTDELPGMWSVAGSAVILATSVLFALSVLGIVPLFGAVSDTLAAWLIIAAQLLSIAPVVMVSHVTLKHGKIDQVLSHALAYVTLFGLFFLALVAGLSVMEPYVDQLSSSRNVLTALFTLVLLVLTERIWNRLRVRYARLFKPERQALYQSFNRFHERLRTIIDFETLARETIQTIGTGLGVRSAVVYLRPPSQGSHWVSSSYHPEPPYLTERNVARLWPHVAREGRIWARNPELNESSALPAELDRLLQDRRVALVIPIQGKETTVGLIALGVKRRRRAVYNLEEVDLLRALSSQLALAVERLILVEREKALVRETAEAQLVALRAQINPHFLFNALNTIMALIAERPDEAEETVAHLAAIFRHILNTGSRPFVTLEEELGLVEHYLHIEQMRFGDKLSVEMTLDPALRHHPVPAFAVQTLVENAVKHGLARRRDGGAIRTLCHKTGDDVEIVVADTGAGIPELFGAAVGAAPKDFYGIGLRNVTSRLEQLYGRDDLLTLTSAPEAGTTAVLRLPFAGPSVPEGLPPSSPVPDARSLVTPGQPAPQS